MEPKTHGGKFIAVAAVLVILLFLFSLWAFPMYNVWRKELRGKADLKEAEWSRQIAIEEAKARKESATLDAEAEVERAKGVADIHFVALEYRSIDIVFPYNEFAICIPVIYKINEQSRELQGYYYLYLPVTTEDARWGGVENLGLPKFVAEIGFADTDEIRSCTLNVDGKEVISLKVNKLPTVSKSWEFTNFGIRDKKLVKNLFQVHGQGGTSTTAGGATYTLGDHPISEKLLALEIGQISIRHDYVPQAQAVLTEAIGPPLPL